MSTSATRTATATPAASVRPVDLTALADVVLVDTYHQNDVRFHVRGLIDDAEAIAAADRRFAKDAFKATTLSGSLALFIAAPGCGATVHGRRDATDAVVRFTADVRVEHGPDGKAQQWVCDADLARRLVGLTPILPDTAHAASGVAGHLIGWARDGYLPIRFALSAGVGSYAVKPAAVAALADITDDPVDRRLLWDDLHRRHACPSDVDAWFDIAVSGANAPPADWWRTVPSARLTATLSDPKLSPHGAGAAGAWTELLERGDVESSRVAAAIRPHLPALETDSGGIGGPGVAMRLVVAAVDAAAAGGDGCGPVADLCGSRVPPDQLPQPLPRTLADAIAAMPPPARHLLMAACGGPKGRPDPEAASRVTDAAIALVASRCGRSAGRMLSAYGDRVPNGVLAGVAAHVGNGVVGALADRSGAPDAAAWASAAKHGIIATLLGGRGKSMARLLRALGPEAQAAVAVRATGPDVLRVSAVISAAEDG